MIVESTWPWIRSHSAGRSLVRVQSCACCFLTGRTRFYRVVVPLRRPGTSDGRQLTGAAGRACGRYQWAFGPAGTGTCRSGSWPSRAVPTGPASRIAVIAASNSAIVRAI